VKIKSIEILTNLTGPDQVCLQLDAKSPFPEMGYPPQAKVEARKGYGLAWAEEHFPGLEITVLDIKAGTRVTKRAGGVVTVEGLRAGSSRPEPESSQVEMGFSAKPVPHSFPIRGDDRYPIQDNGPEVPDYGRGGDGPPAPWCRRCETYHFNRCTR